MGAVIGDLHVIRDYAKKSGEFQLLSLIERHYAGPLTADRRVRHGTDVSANIDSASIPHFALSSPFSPQIYIFCLQPLVGLSIHV